MPKMRIIEICRILLVILIAVVKRALCGNSLIILLLFFSRYCRKQPEDTREQLFCMDCDILLASHSGLLILLEGYLLLGESYQVRHGGG
jgi:hypothetical protein